jgi:hypothetical protein
MRFYLVLNMLSITILLCGWGVASPVVALGDEPVAEESPDAAQWVDSDDSSLALRLSVASRTVSADAEVEITAQIRNTSRMPITLLRPFGDWYQAEAAGIKIWNEKHRLQYTGPTPDYVVLKEGFAVVAPGAMIEDKIKLTVTNFKGFEELGTYALRFDYSYNGGWDKTAGIHGAWRGTISSREVQLKKQEGVAKAPRPSQEQLDADLSKLLPLAKILEEKPDDPTAQQDAAAVAIRLAPHIQGNRIVWDVLIKTRTLKDGMSLAEAEELLGPPARKDGKYVGWYSNPQSKHVAPYLHATVWKDGLAEWKITNR